MHRLSIENYNDVKRIIKDCSCELSIFSVLNGTLPGEVYADSISNCKAAVIKTCETIAIAGDPGNPDFNAFVKENVLGFWDNFILDNISWEGYLDEIHPNPYIKKYLRNKFAVTKLSFKPVKAFLTKEFELVEIIPSKLEKINLKNKEPVLRWVRNWGNYENFLNNGAGYMVVVNDEIASWSVTDCYLDDRAAIGIFTDPGYRKKGLGAICASKTAEHLFNKGMRELEWLCVAVNKGSKAIAGKLGFEFACEYYSYTTYPPYENDTDLARHEWEEQYRFYLEAFRMYPDKYGSTIKRIERNIKEVKSE